MFKTSLIISLAFFSICCNNSQHTAPHTKSTSTDTLVTIESDITDSIINTNDVQAIIDPVWWTGDIYQSYDIYVNSLKSFTEGQRYVYAIQWYQSEVDNGGHDQFFYNSTGIVWQDALKGFEMIGLPKYYKILLDAIKRFKDKPAFDRNERINQLESLKLNFDDLDDRFYSLDKSEPLQTGLMRYIDSNKKEFYYHGQINRPLNVN